MTERKRKIERTKRILRNVRLFTYAIISIFFLSVIIRLPEKSVETITDKTNLWPAEYKVVYLPHDAEEIREKLIYIQKRYGKVIKRESGKHGVEVKVVMVIIRIESNGNVDAHSSAGALCLMQVKKSTAKDMKIKYPRNPSYNIAAGTKYYRKMLVMFGDRNSALAAYNMGPNDFKRKSKDFDKDEYFYVKNFEDTMNVLQYAM